MDRRERLVALRDQLTALLAGADERTAPALSRELRSTLVELESMPDTEKQATVDDLKGRRAARQAASADRAHTAGGE